MIVDLEMLDKKRRLAGLTRADLAGKVGVAPLSIGRFLNGKTCSVKMVKRVCHVLDVPVDKAWKE